MELVPAGVTLSFEVSFAPDLFGRVGMSVFDDTGSSPVLLLSPFAMALVAEGTYRGKFTPALGKSYVIRKCVYTDDTLTDLDPNFGEGSESIYAQNFNSSPTVGCVIKGVVNGSCECGEPAVFSIFQGDNRVLPLRAVNVGCNSNPLDLTQCTEIDVELVDDTGVPVHLLLSEGDVSIFDPPILGNFGATISSEVSVTLNPGQFQTFYVTFTISGEKITVPYRQALSVFQRS